MYFIHHCFICRPSDSIVSEEAGVELVALNFITISTELENVLIYPKVLRNFSVFRKIFLAKIVHLNYISETA